VFLDARAYWAHVREALRLGAVGYRTLQEPLEDVIAGLQAAAAGELSFCDEVAEKLSVGDEGLCLASSNGFSAFARLTERERDVLASLAKGISVSETANNLGLAVSTVDNHKYRLMKKLNLHSTTDLVLLALREGLAPLG
jgi:DNA-binding NarL/FixJ family response regulator